MSGLATKKPSNLWLIDSGAIHHMTYDRKLFKELNKSTVTKIIVANGEHIEVEGTGTITIPNHSGLKLTLNVLYVPKLNQNLLSVPQLLEQGYYVVFAHKACLIKYPNNKDVIKIQLESRKFVLDSMIIEQATNEDKNQKEFELKNDQGDANDLKKVCVKRKNGDVGEEQKQNKGTKDDGDLKGLRSNDALNGLGGPMTRSKTKKLKESSNKEIIAVNSNHEGPCSK